MNVPEDMVDGFWLCWERELKDKEKQLKKNK